MQTRDWWYLVATVVSPFLAAGLTALFTLAWQNRKEMRDAKLRVFSTLMAARGNIGNFQVAQEWAKALNLIDVVFHDEPTVITAWHTLYSMLQQPSPPPGQGHQTIELMTVMATSLGYKNLKQTDIDKSHLPMAISEPIAKLNELSDEPLRVLQGTEALLAHPRVERPESAAQVQRRSQG